jgi:hypothetical protein
MRPVPNVNKHRFAFLSLFLSLIALFIGGIASGNPLIPGQSPPPRFSELNAYIDSEKLLVTISSTNAIIKGTFTFASLWQPSKDSGAQPPTHADVDLPLWLPENKPGDPFLNKFWKGFSRHGSDYLCDNLADEFAFLKSIAIRVNCKNPVLLPLTIPIPEMASSGVKSFTDSEQPSEIRFFSCHAMNRPDWMTEEQGPNWGYDPGFCFLMVRFCLSLSAVSNHYPITISYQHPLVQSNGDHRFYYIPNFDNLPKGVSTTNTNRYSVTVTAAPCCSLIVTTSDKITIPPPKSTDTGPSVARQKFVVEPGHSITFAPEHLQPIRVLSKPR